jgi:hypothetical protein
MGACATPECDARARHNLRHGVTPCVAFALAFSWTQCGQLFREFCSVTFHQAWLFHERDARRRYLGILCLILNMEETIAFVGLFLEDEKFVYLEVSIIIIIFRGQSMTDGRLPCIL